MTATPAASEPLLRVSDLVKHFPVKSGILVDRTVAHVHAVDGVSLTLDAGTTLGLVGESGSGKSTLGYTILQLLKANSGSVRFEGRELTKLSREELRQTRRDMQIVFQDPYSSLNPRMTVGNIIAEPLLVHKIGSRKERRAKVDELLEIIGFDASFVNRYPHEFSGGQRQRIGIARALALRPKMIVCDEPVSALDVSIQAQILNLLKDIQDEFGIAYLFIAHNLAVVRNISDCVAVMYLGCIMESAPAEELYGNPLHPYTKSLLSAVPVIESGPAGDDGADAGHRRERIVLPGDVPSPVNPPSGCRFHTRCPYVQRERCPDEVPLLRPVEANMVACHWAEEIKAGKIQPSAPHERPV